MRAALITSFDQPPIVADIAAPEAGPDQLVVDVLAAALHPRVRSQANGSHYSSTGALPLVPGVDGVGRTAAGELRYFVLPDGLGSMAEQTVIDVRRSLVLPPDTDPVLMAAAVNPAMSSWLALRLRLDVAPGFRTLVLGATGNAGRLAVDVATHLGAASVVGAGRDQDRLRALSDAGIRTVDLTGDPADLADAGRDVDVVLDYVWGETTAGALRAIIPARADDQQRLQWVQIGSVGGLESPIPSAALRATRLELVGSGQGSLSPRAMLGELPSLIAEIAAGTFAIDARAVTLEEAVAGWEDSTRERLVVVP